MRVTLVLLIAGVTVTLAGCAGEDAQPALPNVVIVYADDLGYGDPGCYNRDSLVDTPNMDRLCNSGVRFTDAHSASAVCTPSRYALLTGRYSWRTSLKNGVLWGYSPALIDTARTTLPDIMRKAGYRTAGIGKWHLGLGSTDTTDYTQPFDPSPLDYGFDHYWGIPASLDMQPYVYMVDDGMEEAPTDSVAFSEHRRKEGGGFWRAGPVAPSFKHADVLPRIGDHADAYVRDQTDSDQPFFLYVPLTAPHTPWLPSDEFRGTTGAGYYGDFVAMVDQVVGQILDAVESSGKRENTMIIMTSDNGAHWLPSDIEHFGHRANGPLRGQKADIHEGGHRVPFMVSWPARIPAGEVRDKLVTQVDLMATMADLVGEELGPGVGEDSFSLLPAVFENEAVRSSAVHHSLRGMFAIRSGKWKLIDGLGSGGFTQPAFEDPVPGGPVGQLFDLESDPGEQVNLCADSTAVVERLTGLLESIKEDGSSTDR